MFGQYDGMKKSVGVAQFLLITQHSQAPRAKKSPCCHVAERERTTFDPPIKMAATVSSHNEGPVFQASDWQKDHVVARGPTQASARHLELPQSLSVGFDRKKANSPHIIPVLIKKSSG